MEKKHTLFLKFLLLLFLLPLLYINVKSTVDWGDDFAQYILQAKGICAHSFSSIYNVTGLEQYSPQFRPVGFPLVLAPFYAFFGNNTYAFEMMNSVFLIILCLTLFTFFRNHFSTLSSFLLVLVFAYNPWVLNLKQQIMPEIIFTLLLITTFLVYSKKDNSYQLKTAFLIACLLLVKYIGFALLIAYVAQLLFSNLSYYIKHKQILESKQLLRGSLIIIIVPLIIYYLVSDIILKLPQENIEWYDKFFISKAI